ncbi:phage tail assembly chaperone family protein, TAC [Rouxiella badensis]|uniref:phage tail assembly chaperone family protein, TAC n=1 Tax=Rouxiella badensis TaxID=1646377 RepID=UPI001D13C1A1|nr:phage tail assembly chaperone family protein, TAC [Rouxiella badensis]MCC3720524.1 phage tail assembly chaperone family protein, TAC [Rouxiella badensis]MCC3730363.1 phage tail assembly chaperone family protein, TAC [Rouxiella badensis]MCC3742186.1 phage tail assembly chaperone family protein, TAC [Rouxiella badensis]
MKLSLETLKKSGAFTGRPVEKLITWKLGDEEFTATVFVRPEGFHSAMSGLRSLNGQDTIAGRIAASICDEEGKPIFTAEDITGEADEARGALDGNLAVALLVAIHEVNELGKTKKSPNQKKSGAN